MAEVLLVYPSYALLGKDDNLRGKESLTPSLGLASLASYLKAQDVTVKVLDLRVADDSYQLLVNDIRDENPVLVGITGYYAYQTRRLVKENQRDRQMKYFEDRLKFVYPPLLILMENVYSRNPKDENLLFKESEFLDIKEIFNKYRYLMNEKLSSYKTFAVFKLRKHFYALLTSVLPD